jgi:drug/metabolite transporter (DMT)-like permease
MPVPDILKRNGSPAPFPRALPKLWWLPETRKPDAGADEERQSAKTRGSASWPLTPMPAVRKPAVRAATLDDVSANVPAPGTGPVPSEPDPLGPSGAARNATLGALLAALAMFGFAAMDSMSKFLVREYPIAQTLCIRYVIYTGFAVLVVRRHGLRTVIRSRRPWLQAFRALLALVESAVFVLAFAYLPLAETHAVAATSPLIVIVLAAPLLHERVGLHRWLAVVAGFTGVLLIIRPGFQAFDWPLMIPLLGAFLWGLYQILVRLCGRDDSPETTLLWSAVVGLAAISIVAPFQWHEADAFAWALLSGMGLLGALAHFALIKALDFAEASAIQPYGYTLLVWAVVLGFVVFGDVPGPWTILGGGVVVLSGLYTWHHDRQRTARDSGRGTG